MTLVGIEPQNSALVSRVAAPGGGHAKGPTVLKLPARGIVSPAWARCNWP